MMYDVSPEAVGAPGGFTLDTPYKTVLEAVSKIMNKDKIVMGFEPGN